MRLFLPFLAALFGLLLVSGSPLSASDAAPPTKPNLLLILADDVGQEVLGCYGGESYATPRIDRLAASGMRFEHGYSMAVCHPTRVALLSGRYPFRMGRPGWGTYPREEEALTIASLLRRAGYATAVAGKWQLTLLKEDPAHPKRMGFDRSCLFGWHEGPRYYAPLIWQDGAIRAGLEKRFGPEVYTDFLIDFMRASGERPFFAYYSMALCHDVTDDLKEPVPYRPGKDRYDTYAEMVSDMDRMVGKLVDALERLGLRRRTLVLFVGDNGTAARSIIRAEGKRYIREPVVSTWKGVRRPGGKGTLRDAGTRVPWIASWPGTTPSGRVVDDLVDVTDILPTFLELAGSRGSVDRPLDGVSFAGRLRGGAPSSRRWVFAEHGGRSFVRTRRWKLYDDGKLFDVESDVEERRSFAPGDAPADGEAARARLARVGARLAGAPPGR